MNSTNQNSFSTKSTRLPYWNYSSPGLYFVIICANYHKHFFGSISNTNLEKTQIGAIAEKYWSEIPLHFSNVELLEFVIMPNHIHGIIFITNVPADSEACVNQRSAPNSMMSEISPKRGALSTIIRSYKSAVTREARLIVPPFKWQPRFYESIIRNESMYLEVAEYIRNNERQWALDRFNMSRNSDKHL